MSQQEFDYFTSEGAFALINEVEAYLDKARAAVKAGRFVEAEAWFNEARNRSEEQDVFGMLAAEERNKVSPLPAPTQQ